MKATEFQCQVSGFKQLTPTVFELSFTTEAPIEFQAGQFISCVIPGAGPKGRDLRRAYSIASSPEMRPLELCIKLVDDGPGTNYLCRLRPGDHFRGFAPYGDFVYEAKPGRHICFIATGTGIAPFRSVVLSDHYQKNPPKSATCLFGVRTEDEILYNETFEEQAGMHFAIAVSQPSDLWKGFRGRVTDYIKSGRLGDFFPWKETEYYLCGHGGMIADVKKFLMEEKGVEKDSIHQEIYYK